MAEGIVYLVSNPCFPDYVKIGRCEVGRLQQRLKELSRTSVPVGFELQYAVKVEDAEKTEKLLHRAFSEFRPRLDREFFKIDPGSVRAAMELTGGEEMTLGEEDYIPPEDFPSFKDAQQRERARRDNFRFSDLEIPIGSTLTFVDDKSFTCEVAANNQVKYNGEIMSLSGAANKIRWAKGLGGKESGSRCWTCDGAETLEARRSRLEAGGAKQPTIIPESD